MGIRKLDVKDSMLVQPHFRFSIRKLVIVLKPQLVNLRTELLTAKSDRYLLYPIIYSDQPTRIPLVRHLNAMLMEKRLCCYHTFSLIGLGLNLSTHYLIIIHNLWTHRGLAILLPEHSIL